MTTEERVTRWIKTHGYGLNEKEGNRLITLHEEGSNDDRKFVETLLTDLNFHTACMCLKKGDYTGARFQFVKD
jgi:hypothetical protein